MKMLTIPFSTKSENRCFGSEASNLPKRKEIS
jgi:hypothetical protein